MILPIKKILYDMVEDTNMDIYFYIHMNMSYDYSHMGSYNSYLYFNERINGSTPLEILCNQ